MECLGDGLTSAYSRRRRAAAREAATSAPSRLRYRSFGGRGVTKVMHEGIGGLVPADRFFGAEDVLRKTIEAQLEKNELGLAVEESPRKPVFLFGQIGDQ